MEIRIIIFLIFLYSIVAVILLCLYLQRDSLVYFCIADKDHYKKRIKKTQRAPPSYRHV